MLITIPKSITSLYFCGDLHGNLQYLKYHIKQYNITNSCIICAGDIGLGFCDNTQEINFLNKFCELRNVYLIFVRGNHDDPNIFMSHKYDKYCKTVADYDIINVCNLNILCIGGGISIDREWRKTLSKCAYWEDEIIKYQPKVSEKINIIVSHSAPSFAYPVGIGKIVHDFAENDSTLITDVINERQTLDIIWSDYKSDITHWYYGHYHSTQYQVIDGVVFKLLDISEIVRHVTDNDLL